MKRRRSPPRPSPARTPPSWGGTARGPAPAPEIERAVPGLETEALAALGRLTAGLLHELSHPLQCLADSTSFLSGAYGVLVAALPEDGETDPRVEAAARVAAQIPDALEQMREGMARALDLSRAARTFAHAGSRDLVGADLNHVIRCAIVLVRTRIRPVAVLETDLGRLPAVVCDPGLLTQAIVNLLVNAADALEEASPPRDGQGRIRVRSAVEGDAALVSVSDDGPGVPEALRAQIFQPFFTTKEPGRGTGQGLSIARAIVEQHHGGSLTLETTPGHGATFHIRLPVRGARQPAGARHAGAPR